MRVLIFFFSFFFLEASLAHAQRWEFGCRSMDGSIAFNRLFLELDTPNSGGKKVEQLRFRNLNFNNDPAYADEHSPLEFAWGASAIPAMQLVNLKPGKEAVDRVRLNASNKFCARNAIAYITSFRILREGRARFMGFHCEEAWMSDRIDAERCVWEPSFVRKNLHRHSGGLKATLR